MKFKNFENLVEIIEKLRDPENGCPWDLEQTHESLLKFLVEETYEFIHAVEENNPEKVEEEIGDVLLQVLLHCTIGKEKSLFDLESTSKKLSEKLIRRHPHVFGENNDDIDSNQVVKNWKEIKDLEKNNNIESICFDNSFLSFPSLLGAYKIGQKTNHIKFDWSDTKEVLSVVKKEINELEHELLEVNINSNKVQEELGDILFSMAQLVRHFKFEPEETLRLSNKKFIRRFNTMFNLIEKDSKNIRNMNQNEMDKYWNIVKEKEKK